MQHVLRPALGNAAFQRLQSGPDPGHGAVVIRTLLVDDSFEAALPLVQVVGHIGQEVRVTAVALAHHPVLVVSESGGAQPQGAIELVGMSAVDQALHGGVHLAVLIQRGFQEIVVEVHLEGLQVQVLFTAQVGHGKATNIVQPVRVGGAGHVLVAGIDPVPAQVGLGDIIYVVAAIAVCRPVGIIRLHALAAGLYRQGEVVDLLAGVVVIEFTGHRPAGRLQQAADTVAHRRAASVAHVQGPRGVGGDVFYLHPAALACVAATIGGFLFQDLPDYALAAGLGKEKIDESGTGNVGAGQESGRRQRRADQLGELARVLAGGFRQGQGDIAGQVAVAGVAGTVYLDITGGVPWQRALVHQ